MHKRRFIFFLLSFFVTSKYNFLIANELSLTKKFGIDQNLLSNFNEYLCFRLKKFNFFIRVHHS